MLRSPSSARVPARLRSLLFVLALALPAVASAQQVGESINVLPVKRGGTDLCTAPGGTTIPCDALRGDLFGQRQNEPSIAASTLNKDHIVAFFNDFRAIDVPNDPPLGTTSSALVKLWNGARQWFAKLTNGSRGEREGKGDPDIAANQEAGIGMSVSYDGGLTWTGGFVPGLPFDTTPASLASPAYKAGMQGMSDPVVAAAPCGRFYLAYLAFVRGGASQLLVSVLQDQNNDDLRHTIKWVKTVLVEQGNNGSYGHFLDKPDLEVAPTGATSCSAVTENVYVSYTTFTGNSTSTKFQSKINMATSTDGGNTFPVVKVDDSYTQNQGTAIVVNNATTPPTPYVFWRTFNSPNSIIMSKLTSKGWSRPFDLLSPSNEVLHTIQTFDQPGVSISQTTNGSDGLTFRSNGFPTAAITPDGSTLMVAWQERVNATGAPDPSGYPRIVLKYSRDGGTTWTPRTAIATDHPASPAGLGFFNPGFAVGPQVMPSLSCGPGNPNRCLLTYYESRPYGTSPSFLSANGWIGGYNRVLDLRAVLIDAPPTSPIVANPSFQVSRYSYRDPIPGVDPPGTTLPGEDSSWVSRICPPGTSYCYPSLNYSGIPHTGGGTTPFMGDYNDAKLMVPFVKDATSLKWRAASTADDAPYGAAFITAWADNRNVVRPAPADGSEWTSYTNYSPPGTGSSSCANPGSRDQSVMTAQVSLGLLVTAPTNYKPFVSPNIEFPMTVWNNTGVTKQFRLNITGFGSFSKTDNTDNVGYVTIYPYSSSSVNVYAWNNAQVSVKATDLTPAALTGSISFNSPGSAPPAGAPTPTYVPSSLTVQNSLYKNSLYKNSLYKNSLYKNSLYKNALPTDSSGNTVPVYNVIDYSWTVDPSNLGDAATYLAAPTVDPAYQNDYVFQLFVTKPAPIVDLTNACDPTNLLLGTMVSNISDPKNILAQNSLYKNPVPSEPLPSSPQPMDIVAQNSTFTLGSSTSVVGTTTAGGCDPTTGGGLIGDCTFAAPRLPNEVTITLRAYQITQTPAVVYNPYGDPANNVQPNPPSIAVADYWCTGPNDPSGCTFIQNGPDLAVASPSASVNPTVLPAGAALVFPTAAQTVTNSGNQPAGAHTIGYYISAASTVAGLPRAANGTIDTTSATVYTRQLATVSMAALAVGATESVNTQSLTIPADIPRPNSNGTGTYYLYAYVDSTRVVSEYNENNNIIQGGPITVQAPGYGFLGLQTPCSGTSCAKSGTLPLAWQFTSGGVPVDTVADLPRLKFYASCPAPVGSDGYPSGAILASSAPNAADLTSGNSGWQYFPTTGLSRPQYSWQFNFDSTGLPRGTCYSMYVEVPSTGQVIGSTDPRFKPFGPFLITPQ